MESGVSPSFSQQKFSALESIIPQVPKMPIVVQESFQCTLIPFSHISHASRSVCRSFLHLNKLRFQLPKGSDVVIYICTRSTMQPKIRSHLQDGQHLSKMKSVNVGMQCLATRNIFFILYNGDVLLLPYFNLKHCIEANSNERRLLMIYRVYYKD